MDLNIKNKQKYLLKFQEIMILNQFVLIDYLETQLFLITTHLSYLAYYL